MKRLLEHDFIRFCLVGCLGFLINLALLFLLFKWAGLPILLAQLLGAEAAYLSNFIFHHAWTYGKRNDKTGWQLLVEFHGASWAGLLLSTALVYVFVNILKLNYAEALAIASVVILFWNYFWTKYFIWRLEGQPETSSPTTESKV